MWIGCSYFKLLIDVVLTSNAIGCGLVPIFADAIDRKKRVQLPVTCQGIKLYEKTMVGEVGFETETQQPAITLLYIEK